MEILESLEGGCQVSTRFEIVSPDLLSPCTKIILSNQKYMIRMKDSVSRLPEFERQQEL